MVFNKQYSFQNESTYYVSGESQEDGGDVFDGERKFNIEVLSEFFQKVGGNMSGNR